jgi:hypothetical protein
MGKGVFKKVIANGGKPLMEFGQKTAPIENTAAPSADTASARPSEMPRVEPPPKKETAPGTRPRSVQEPIYGDVEVCRILRIHRRVIAKARANTKKGDTWGCVGLHAGMTMKWIKEQAAARGMSADFSQSPPKPIEEGDRVVSCRLVGTWPNRQRVTVEIVATGERKIATVPDSGEMLMFDIFDCRAHGNELSWDAALNNARY